MSCGKTADAVMGQWPNLNLYEKKRSYEQLPEKERDTLWAKLSIPQQRELELVFQPTFQIPLVRQCERLQAFMDRKGSMDETQRIEAGISIISECMKATQTNTISRITSMTEPIETHSRILGEKCSVLALPFQQLDELIIGISRQDAASPPQKKRFLMPHHQGLGMGGGVGGRSAPPTLSGSRARPLLAMRKAFGFGQSLWDKLAITTFGRQFQFLRGRELCTTYFQLEMELNFRFETRAAFYHAWRRYYPCAQQWRDAQNIACRKIARAHIYVAPPNVRTDEDLIPAIDFSNLPTLPNYNSLPDLSPNEHERIWEGFFGLGVCHYEWSKAAFHLWYSYELKLRSRIPCDKKEVEKAVLRLDYLTRDFIPTSNPCKYTILDFNQHLHVPFQSADILQAMDPSREASNLSIGM